MDASTITTIISSLGFPIAMCIGACAFIKHQYDTNNTQLRELNEQHQIEIRELRQSVDNNTIALTKLIDRLERD